MALVRWEILQRPRAKGGLGIDDLVVKNAVMLFKWWWRYACEEGALWKEIVSSIHKEDLSLLPSKMRAVVPGPWRDIKHLAAEDFPVQNAFVNNLSIQVGDGMKTKFWQHPWLQTIILKERFPMLYNVSSQKRAFVADMGWFEGTQWRWTLSWSMQLTKTEQQQLVLLQTELSQSPPS